MSHGYPGKGGRVGRKEGSGKRESGRKESGTTWCPWTGQLGKEKAPLGEPYGARRKRDFLAIQDWMQGQIRASGGSKGSKELGSQGREGSASWQDIATQRLAIDLHEDDTGATVSLRLLFRLSCFVIRRQSEIAPVYVGMKCHGFAGDRVSESLHNDAAVEFDHLRPVLEPLQRGLVL